MIIPDESDLMRPMPVYGISEWDHNYIKLTSRAKEMNQRSEAGSRLIAEGNANVAAAKYEMGALTQFVNTWTSPYGMRTGMVVRQNPGTGLGGGITHLDTRPISAEPDGKRRVVEAMSAADPEDTAAAMQMSNRMEKHRLPNESMPDTFNRMMDQAEAEISDALSVKSPS